MRTWRVGSISMEVSLLLLGVLLLLSQFFQVKVTTIFLTWWPVILIVLGLELLVYLFLSKQENPVIKYDFLSVVFVGFIGMFAIGMTLLMTTGILDRVNNWVNLEEQTLELPEYDLVLGKNIKRIVMNTANHNVAIENIKSNDISIFGSYRVFTLNEEALVKSTDEYVQMNEKEDTLYIELKQIPNKYIPFQDVASVSTTILVPQNIELEVEGDYSTITLKPRHSETNWTISNVSSVDLFLDEQMDIALNATDVQFIPNFLLEGSQHTLEDDGTIKSFAFGEGSNTLSVHHVQALSINTQ